jgi:GNAT superfamily N-acetyltransferase
MAKHTPVETNAFGDAPESANAFGDVAVMDPPAPPTGGGSEAAAPGVPMESLFGGLEKMAAALPADARRQLDEAARSENDPNTFRMRTANTAFLADRYHVPLEQAAAGYEQLRDNFAKEHLHELGALDDAGFYGKIGAKLERDKQENLMLQGIQVGLFHGLRSGQTFDQAYEEQRKANWSTNPGWDAYRQDYYRELSRKTWDSFSASKKRLMEPIAAVSAYMDFAKRGVAPGEEEKLMEARAKALGTLRGLPDNEASMVMDLAASQASQDTKGDAAEGFLEKTARRAERGVTEFASDAVGSVQEAGRRLFLKPDDAIGARRQAQLERQLDQRIRGEVDPLKANGWIANEALNVAEGMPRFVSAFSIPGIVANFAATKEELRGGYEDQGVGAGKADVLSGIAAIPQTALNFVSSKMAIGVVPGASRFLAPVTEAGLAPLAKQVGKYLVAESIVQPILQGGATLAPSAVQTIASHFDETIPDIPGGFMKQAELVARSTPETFASLLPFILLGTGLGTFHDRAAGKAYLQNETRLTALGVTAETKAAVMAAPTPEKAALELQKGWEGRTPSPAQKEALATLDAEALKSRAAHGESFSPTQADLMAKYPGTFSMIEPGHLPVEILRADGKTVPASFAGWGERPDANGVNQPAEVVAHLKPEGWVAGYVKEGEKLLTPVPSSEEWAAGVRQGAGSSLQEFTAKWAKDGVRLDLTDEGKGTINLDLIEVPEGQRGQGIGTKVLTELKDLADQTGRAIELLPAGSLRYEGGKVVEDTGKRLEAFYQRNGFSPVDRGVSKLTGKPNIKALRYEAGSREAARPALGSEHIEGENPNPTDTTDHGAAPVYEPTPEERIHVTRGADDSYTVTGHHGELIGTAASAEGAARIVHDQGMIEEPSAPTNIPPAESKLLDELGKIPGAEHSIADSIQAKIQEWQKLGIAPRMEGLDFAKGIGLHVRSVVTEFGKLKRFTPLKQALAEWNTKRGLAQLEIDAVVRNIKKVAPTVAQREGITNWIQANGDRAILQDRYNKTSKLARKDGYKAALNLTPDQLHLADVVKRYYAEKLVEGKAQGLLEHAVENYVTQIWDRPGMLSGKGGSPFRAMLTQNFKFSQEREFGSFFEGEQAGFNPQTKDVAELLAIYSNEMSKVIATRELIKDLTTRKASDDRPGAAPVGAASESEGDGNTKTLIKPLTKGEDSLDYETLNHPALSQWKWVANVEGKQVMLQGQLGLHPEIFKFIKNALGRSEISRWYESDSASMTEAAAKAFVSSADHLLAAGKATSLGGVSTFHLAHEVKRVAGNRVNPFDLPKLDFRDPVLKRAMESSLQVVGDNEAMNQFQEGLGARSAVDLIPGLGRVSRAVSEFTFHDFIPRAKFKLWTALVERNTQLYAKELQEGTVSQKDVDYLSAQQANARLGHLNYTDLGTNPTLRHVLRMTLLAPDFLRSNLQNYRQVAEGLVGKSGRQPLAAFALTAGVVFVAARILNQLLDNDPHLEEPFGVVHANRVYTMRNEVEDLWRATHNPRGYISGRISSFTRLLSELRSGTNWRGEKQDAFDTFKDFLAAQMPMSMSGLPGIRDLTETGRNSRLSATQAILSSQGVQVQGKSVINDAYRIAHQYYHDHGGKEDKGVYPTSRYQQLRYALEDGNVEKAKAQLEKLLKETPEKEKLKRAFHSSVHHPFTGTKAMDEEMLASLKGDDLKKLEEAIQLRNDITDEFERLLDAHD